MPKFKIHIKSLKHGTVNVSAKDETMARELALEPTILATGKWDNEEIEIIQFLPTKSTEHLIYH